MRIGPYKALGPDLKTTWGTYQSPFIAAPSQAKPWLPPTIRGRHPYRVQPRGLSLLPPDPLRQERMGVMRDALMRDETSLVPGSVVGHGVGADDPQKETKLGLYVFLGAVGLFAVSRLMGGR